MKQFSILILLIVGLTSCQNDKHIYTPGVSQDNPNWVEENLENRNNDDGKGLPDDIGDAKNWDDVKQGDTIFKNEAEYREVKRYSKAVYFAYDSAVIGTAYEANLKKVASYLVQNPNYRLTIEGHCDERGTEKYNRALSERRALAVKKYLMARNVDGARLITVGYGEEKLASNGKTSKDHALNRRAEFILAEKITK